MREPDQGPDSPAAGPDAPQGITIRPATETDEHELVQLIAGFRVALGELRNRMPAPDLEAASAELEEYRAASYPIYVAEAAGDRLAGYVVCKIEGSVVWAESLYVDPAYRRQGIAAALYAAAERLSAELGGDTVYTWVHPNNDSMIAFLRSRGYTVLNLVELRRPYPGEAIENTIQVGDHHFES